MGFLSSSLGYLLPFLIVLTVLVFIHELGHYWVARRCGVRVEMFSIGFGPELFGFFDKAGTRWKFSLLPLGGFVKMFGDQDAASKPVSSDEAAGMSAEDRKVSFIHKRLSQRAAIVAAGPIANFLFAIVVLSLLFATVGQPFTPPVLGDVLPDSAASHAGLLAGDRVESIAGQGIDRFEDLTQAVRLRPDETFPITVERNGQVLNLMVTPKASDMVDNFGNRHRVGQLGVRSGPPEVIRRDPATAVWRAVLETVSMVRNTGVALGQMVAGTRSTEDLGGPLRIAQMSKDFWRTGAVGFVTFMAILSINLGLINLFPVPMLDGGHLMIYGIEALRGRPLGERALNFSFRVGLALVVTLGVFALWNDLVNLKAVEYVRNLIS
jgi:regulator of sigma E protease